MKRTVHEWGVRLFDQPLADMYIQAEISKRPGQGVDTRYFFSGTTVKTPLRAGDIQTWLSAMKALFEAAQAEAQKTR